MKKAKFSVGDKVFLTDAGKEYTGIYVNSMFVVEKVKSFRNEYYYDIHEDGCYGTLFCDVEEGALLTPEESLLKTPIPNLCKLSDALDCLDKKEKIATVSYDTEKDNRKLTVNILGTDYTVVEKPIKDCDGYCDKTTKEIAVAVKEDDCDLGKFEEHRKKVLRHEIIHAYHHESGLGENFENKQYGFSETVVDWFAYQSPKIFKTFEELGIL